MLKYGIVQKVHGTKAMVDFEDFGFQGVWLDVPQKFTVTKKSKYLPEEKQLVACILSEDFSEGVVIGGIYNDVDIPPDNTDYTMFENGDSFCHTENGFIFDGNICCTKDVSDKKGSLESVRQHSNNHVHPNGNNGTNTGSATEKVE